MLNELRNQIDEIDKNIVRLYEERMEVAEKVAEIKINERKPVYDKERERQKINAVKSMTHNEFNNIGIEELYEQIMSMSRKLQYRLIAQNGILPVTAFNRVAEIKKSGARVVTQGIEGSYADEAADVYFGQGVSKSYVETFRDAMEAIKAGYADFAVLPIENSTAGIVSDIYDLMVEYDHYIVDEQIIRISHCLLGVKGGALSDIRRVYAHPQALMQCSEFFRYNRHITPVSMLNNAFAAKKVTEDKDNCEAAIAGKNAADIYGLDILMSEVQDNKKNATRFIIIGAEREYRENAGKN